MLAFLKGQHRRFAVAAGSRFIQRTFGDTWNAAEIALGDIVRRAGAHGFGRELLADHAGYEDEGNVGSKRGCDPERLQAREIRQGIVREDQVILRGAERRLEIAPNDGSIYPRIRTKLEDLTRDQVGINAAVFQQQDAGSCLRLSGHESLLHLQGRLAGKGSLRTAHTVPRWRIASKNALNSTGFTTKEFTPTL